MPESMDLPKTTRFYVLPGPLDLKSYANSYENCDVLLNGLTAQYNPFSYPQERTRQTVRLNVPLDLQNILSRLQYPSMINSGLHPLIPTVSDPNNIDSTPNTAHAHLEDDIVTNTTNHPKSNIASPNGVPNPTDSSIPTFQLTQEQYANPILIIERLTELGRRFGAVKLIPPKQERPDNMDPSMQINPDLFWFQANRLLNNPNDNELKNRLDFHNELVKFYADRKDGITISETTMVSTEDMSPTFTSKLPMIDKRPLDLYKLFRSVIVRGGFLEVINKKLWAQIGRELGYRGKIMTSLSSSLKAAYLKILYPYELHIYGLEETGKRSHLDHETHSNLKRKRLESPLILGSPKIFKRSVKSKVKRGFLLNTLERIELKQLNTIVSKPAAESPVPEDKESSIKREDTPEINTTDPYPISVPTRKKGRIPALKNASITVPITPITQLSTLLKTIAENPNNQDSLSFTSNIKISSIYSLRQFVEKDLKFQEYLLKTHPMFANCKDLVAEITEEQFDHIFWEFILNNGDSPFNSKFLQDGLELENSIDVSSFVNGSAFARLGDDLQKIKFNMANKFTTSSSEVDSSSVASPQNGLLNMNLPLRSSTEMSTNVVKDALDPWNLHNLPILPNSLFGVLGENDINNQDIYTPTVNVGMTFSTENWRAEDHFANLCDYHVFGAPKKWLFIPELEFDKFEALIKEVSANETRLHINNNDWNTKSLLKSFPDQWTLESEAFVSLVESIVPPYSDYNNNRSRHSNEKFQSLVDYQRKLRQNDTPGGDIVISYNQDCFITPEQLKASGIKHFKSIQNPGEIIVKFPKSYSATVSMGLNLSEQVNFVTQNWLNYAIEAEDWLNKQLLIPNFLTFKLLVSLAQLLESNSGVVPEISYDAKVFEKALELYEKLLERELELRSQIKKLNLKEVSIDEAVDLDTISDDDLLNIYPSRVSLVDTKNGQKMFVSLQNYLHYIDTKNPVVEDGTIKAELQYFCSEDKLRHYEKLLKGFLVDYEKWMTNYEAMMAESDLLPLKTFKLLLWEAEKIRLAANSLAIRDNKSVDVKSPEYLKFEEYIRNIGQFVKNASDFVDECQLVLSVKHQQRIRGGGSSRRRGINDSSEDKAVEKIVERPTETTATNTNTTGSQTTDVLERLVKLLDAIPTINFACPEADQIIELQIEIENFERATRHFLESGKRSLQEFNDLISLGESFGVELPSLKFLKRVKSRIVWLKDFEIIKNGGDPSDTKTFALKDLKQFYIDGRSILGSTDLETYKQLEGFVNDSETFEQAVKTLLSFDLIDLLSLHKLDEYTRKLQSLVLFLYQDTFDQLVVLNDNFDMISKVQSLKISLNLGDKGKFKYGEIVLLKNAINESGLLFTNDILTPQLDESLAWSAKVSQLFRDDAFRSTFLRTIRPNRTLQDKIEASFGKLAYSFGDEDQDSYLSSSSYLAITDGDLSDDKTPLYCTCREPEFGNMIGCDICFEWFHVHCVQEQGKPALEYETADKYACPLCILSMSSISIDQCLNVKPNLEQIRKAIKEAKALVLKPDEFEDLQEFLTVSEQASFKFQENLNSIKNGEDTLEIKVDKIRFHLRKMYGSSVFLEDVFIDGMAALRKLDTRLQKSKEERSRETTEVKLEPKAALEPEESLQEEVKRILETGHGVDIDGTKAEEIPVFTPVNANHHSVQSSNMNDRDADFLLVGQDPVATQLSQSGGIKETENGNTVPSLEMEQNLSEEKSFYREPKNILNGQDPDLDVNEDNKPENGSEGPKILYESSQTPSQTLDEGFVHTDVGKKIDTTNVIINEENI